MTSFYRLGNGGAERLNDMLKATQKVPELGKPDLFDF